MKFLARSQNGQFVSIGNDVETARWYTVTDAVKEPLSSLAIGDEITFAFDTVSGKAHLAFLAKGKVAIPEPWASKLRGTAVKAEPQPQPAAAVIKEEPKPVVKEEHKPFEPKKFDAEQSLRQTCLNVAGAVFSALATSQGSPTTKEKAIEDIRFIYSEVLNIVKK